MKRVVWRWDANTIWGPVAIAVGSIPVAVVGIVLAPGDFDRRGSGVMLAIGLVTLRGVVAYLDRRIDRQ